jgi:hypothetical protein
MAKLSFALYAAAQECGSVDAGEQNALDNAGDG